jgi:hypothetical protein
MLMFKPSRRFLPFRYISHQTYKVTDIQLAYSLLKERQVKFIDAPHIIAHMPDHDLWMVFFHDPDGNVLALMGEEKIQ